MEIKHYSIKHNVCVIDISTFTYKNAFNWSIYTRILDELYEQVLNNDISSITFKNFDKLFRITKTNVIGQSPNKYYALLRRRNLVEKILNYTYFILDMCTHKYFDLDKTDDCCISIKVS